MFHPLVVAIMTSCVMIPKENATISHMDVWNWEKDIKKMLNTLSVGKPSKYCLKNT